MTVLTEWSVLAPNEQRQFIYLIIAVVVSLVLIMALITVYICGLNKLAAKLGKKHRTVLTGKKAQFARKIKKKTLKQSFNVYLKRSVPHDHLQ